jgi:hypothetical protein
VVDLPSWTVAFDVPEDAKHAAKTLARWGIGTRVVALLASPYTVEVSIIELPAQWIHAPSVVAREPYTSDPYITEVDEHDIGRSSWWDRD